MDSMVEVALLKKLDRKDGPGGGVDVGRGADVEGILASPSCMKDSNVSG